MGKRGGGNTGSRPAATAPAPDTEDDREILKQLYLGKFKAFHATLRELYGYMEEVRDIPNSQVSFEEKEEIREGLYDNVPEDAIKTRLLRNGVPPTNEMLRSVASQLVKLTRLLKQNLEKAPTIEQLKQRKFTTAKSVTEVGMAHGLSPDLTRHLGTFLVGEPKTLNTDDVQAQRKGVALAPRVELPLNRTKHNEGGRRRRTRKHKKLRRRR